MLSELSDLAENIDSSRYYRCFCQECLKARFPRLFYLLVLQAKTSLLCSLVYESSQAPTKDLRDAIRAGSKYTLDELLERPGSEIELMAQNAANGAGLLMIAAEMGNEKMLEYLACKIREKVG